MKLDTEEKEYFLNSIGQIKSGLDTIYGGEPDMGNDAGGLVLVNHNLDRIAEALEQLCELGGKVARKNGVKTS